MTECFSRHQGSEDSVQVIPKVFDFKLATRDPWLLIAMHTALFAAASIKLHESGWAWLVAGSKLFLWKFSTMQPSVSVHVVLQY